MRDLTSQDLRSLRACVHNRLKARPERFRLEEEDIVQEAALLLASEDNVLLDNALARYCATTQAIREFNISPQAVSGLAEVTAARRRAAALARFAASTGRDQTLAETKAAFDDHVRATRKDPVRQGALLRGNETMPTVEHLQHEDRLVDDRPGPEDTTADADEARQRLADLRAQLSPQARKVLDTWLQIERSVSGNQAPVRAPRGEIVRRLGWPLHHVTQALAEIYGACSNNDDNAALVHGEEMMSA